MQDATDEQLLQEARASVDFQTRRELIDTLFARYHTRIALWCYRITGDRESGADLAQEVLMRAYRNLDSFRGDSKFSTWLYTITRNHCFNSAKRSSTRNETSMDPLDLDAAVEDRFDLRLERKQDFEQMQSLVAETLDDTEQRVMTLHYGEEMPLETVTRLLGLLNQSGAKAYVVSARRKLKTAVERLRAKRGGAASW